MKYTHVRVRSGTSAVDFKMRGASPKDPFIAKDIQGLTAPAIDVSMSNSVDQAGTHQSSLPGLREITILTKLNPNWAEDQDVSDLRALLYNQLTKSLSGTQMEAIVMNGDDELFKVNCWPSKMEQNPFTSNPEVQLVLSCDSAYFSERVDHQVYTPSLNKLNPVIPNVGSAPTGFRMQITLTSDLSSFMITSDSGAQFRIEYPFVTGDALFMRTHLGGRILDVRKPDTSVKSLMPYLTRISKWPQLHDGNNTFQFSTDRFYWNFLDYQPLYWGI